MERHIPEKAEPRNLWYGDQESERDLAARAYGWSLALLVCLLVWALIVLSVYRLLS